MRVQLPRGHMRPAAALGAWVKAYKQMRNVRLLDSPVQRLQSVSGSAWAEPGHRCTAAGDPV